MIRGRQGVIVLTENNIISGTFQSHSNQGTVYNTPPIVCLAEYEVSCMIRGTHGKISMKEKAHHNEYSAVQRYPSALRNQE